MHRLADRVVTAEGEGNVRDATADLGVREGLLDQGGRLEEIDRVVVMLLDARRDSEDVRIEDDVLGGEVGLRGEELVGAGADADLFVAGGGLALFVEGHHDRRGAVAADEAGAAEELVLAVLERDRIHDALALQTLETLLEDRPFGRVDHDRHARDFRLGRDQVEKLYHRRLAVDQRLVDIDIENVRAAFHLLAGDRDTGIPISGLECLGELRRARDVRALPDDEELRGRSGGRGGLGRHQTKQGISARESLARIFHGNHDKIQHAGAAARSGAGL